MRPRVLLAAVVAAGVTAVPAVAQRTGTRIGSEAGPRDAPTIFRMFAACVYARQPKNVLELLVTLPGSTEEGMLIKHMEADFPICLDNDALIMDGKTLKVNKGLFRRGLAESVVHRTGAALPTSRPAWMKEDPWFLDQVDKLPKDSVVDKGTLAVMDFGHCVAFKDWPDTVAFVSSDPGQPGETQAVTALMPSLGPCMVAGSAVKLGRSTLRSILSESVWHVVVPDAPSASKQAIN